MNGLIKVEGFKITPKGEIGEKTDKKETPKAQEYTQEEKDKITNAETSKYPMYKSEDIVSKAVELINIAYDEMNKAEGGDSGTATTSTEGTTNFVYSDVHEANKNTEEARAKETERDAKGTARQRSLKLDEAGAAQAAADKLKPSN